MTSSVSASDRSATAENLTATEATSEDDTEKSLSAVPAIVLQDGTRTISLGKKYSPRSQTLKDRQSSNATSETNTNPPGGESFRVINTDIPTGTFEDPFSSRMQFSNRGSVILEVSEATTFARTQRANSVRSSLNRSPALQQRGGIRASSQRCVSADDRQLSRRVRSFYEPEMSIAEEPASLKRLSSTSKNANSEEIDKVPALASGLAPRHLLSGDRLRESHSASALSMRSAVPKGPNDAAGGIEDWTDVDIRDVDRWGFIKPRSPSSKRSSVISGSAPGSSDPQRGIRTGGEALSVVDEAHSENAESRPQAKTTRLSWIPGAKPLKRSPSMLSSRSKRSTTSKNLPFRNASGRPRWLMDAPDMLVAPSCLGDESYDAHFDPIREARRADKWQKMAQQKPNSQSSRGAGTKYVFNITDPKLISRVWKGIPDRWRSEAWFAFLTSSAARQSSSKRPDPPDEDLENFFHSCQDDDCVDDVQIDMDVPRTIGNHLQFRKRYHGGQRFLFRVLRALALYFPETGYVQGMASVVATLLVYYEESRAFVMAVRLWQLRGVKNLYSEGFEGLMTALQELEERWVRRTEVTKQLDRLGIDTSAWGPKWYLTLFNYVLPFHTMLRVWDVFMLLGDPPPSARAATGNGDNYGVNFDVLHAAAAAMLSALRDLIVDADFENAMKALTSSVRVGKDDQMMLVARKLWEERKAKR